MNPKLAMASMLTVQSTLPNLNETERRTLLARARALRNEAIQDRLTAFQQYVDADGAKRAIH
jgi:hypothetical protein